MSHESSPFRRRRDKRRPAYGLVGASIPLPFRIFERVEIAAMQNGSCVRFPYPLDIRKPVKWAEPAFSAAQRQIR
ncbi:hypothetical protein GCWU000341_00123 [Oribacterium sp. oral taxon 078 str. F0262]|nr:hypothetical protein GCWU000341_00123 [Oribacterium sp. oral taxon 078 str. F0262]